MAAVRFILDRQLLVFASCALAYRLHPHKELHSCWVERLLVSMACFRSCWLVSALMICLSFQQHLIKPTHDGQLQTEWEKVWDMLAPQLQLLHWPMLSHSSLVALVLLTPSQVSVSLQGLVFLCFILQAFQYFQLSWYGNYEDNRRKKEIAVEHACAKRTVSYAARADSWLRLKGVTHSKEKRLIHNP